MSPFGRLPEPAYVPLAPPRAWTVIVAASAALVLTGATLAVDIALAAVPHGLEADHGHAGPAGLRLADGGLHLLAALAVVAWVALAATAAARLRPAARVRPAWTALSLLVPGAQLFVPAWMLRRAWRATGPGDWRLEAWSIPWAATLALAYAANAVEFLAAYQTYFALRRGAAAVPPDAALAHAFALGALVAEAVAWVGLLAFATTWTRRVVRLLVDEAPPPLPA